MKQKPASRRAWTGSAAGAAAFGLASLAAMAAFAWIFRPARQIPAAAAERGQDRSVMRQALAPEAVRRTLDEIEALGSRSPGQPGHAALAALIADRYRRAGLEVMEQELDTVHPCTTNAVLTVDGAQVNLTLWSAPPNHVQPHVTPPEGLEGELLLVTPESIREGVDFHDKIALVDLARPLFKELELNPARYCELGFRAMIVSHADGLDQMPWPRLAELRLTYPLNYVRLVADRAIFDYAGRRVRLDVQAAYQSFATRNLIGVMRAPGGASRRAMVVGVSYDGFTVLPDLNHGSLQALQVALQLRLLEGLAPHRAHLQRDVVFVATGGDYMAQDSLDTLLATLGIAGESATQRARIEDAARENSVRLDAVNAIATCLEDERFAREPAASDALLRPLPETARDLFHDQFRLLLRRRVFDAAETLLQAQIRFERHPDDLTGAPYREFLAAKRRHDRLNTLSALPLSRYLERGDIEPFDLRAALRARFAHLRAFHETRARRLRQELALNTLLGGYGELMLLSPALCPTTEPQERETISFSGGGSNIPYAEAANAFLRLLQDAVFTLDLQDRVAIDFRGARHGNQMATSLAGMPLFAFPWSILSHPGFAVISPRNDYRVFMSPLPPPAMTNLASLAASMQVMGEAALAAAYGQGVFRPLQRNYYNTYALRGSVYAAGVGNAVVPNFPVEGALVCRQEESGVDTPTGGYQNKNLFFTDPYGRYEKAMLTVPFPKWNNFAPVEAALFAADGRITHYKDSGMAAQNIYNSREINYEGLPANLILFRGSPVALLNRVNPQSMRNFTGVELLKVKGLAPFASKASFTAGSGFLEFVDPRARFFVTLKAGAPDNEQVAATRAFCLGTRDPTHVPDPDQEIDGPGYLAQDTPVLRDLVAEAAASMSLLAGKRLALQHAFGMADEMTARFHARSREALDAAARPGRRLLERLADYRQAAAYQILNHPVIRGTISEAVWGILWYMGLLVPFIFFFEKLVFGFTDIRRQLAAQGLVFLAVFLLLRLLHPAFQMIRSSMMILLGFVIILISAGITLVLSSKFKENLDALRRAQGAVRGAEVNKAGVMLTAFMLGLNNMHKRKVRTGLTCATLVLLTFVMICFTSVRSRIVEKERALGKAPYQGLLLREPRFMPISAGEIAALDGRYGGAFAVNERIALVGRYIRGSTAGQDLDVVHGEGPDARRLTAKSALLFRATEPMQGAIRLLTTNGWFTAAQAQRTAGPYPVILSDDMAGTLGLAPAAVDAGGRLVKINGVTFEVHGVFDAESLEQARDLDGDTLLPFDAEAVVSPQLSGNSLLAERDDPRLPAARIILGLAGGFPVQTAGEMRTLSVAVDMGNTGFVEARREVARYLEQTGRQTCYGLDGTAYLGQRARRASLAGLADLLIPLVIAALTVLNTMKGSVYERRDEIFVYNAVGIAPRYVFFMFVAEALVYSVVGAVLGYILSQGTGRILTALDWTGGLNMNFTSISTIYASLAIAAATLASTYFPARSAMQIAKPADNAGWKLPATENDELAFDLPFTFTHFDRIAVLGFFHAYFVNHGEGSAGPFFAAEPRLVIARGDELADGAPVPALDVLVWLKPFDLGVSQRIVIELAADAATGEYLARMRLQRQTGAREAWLRLNAPLVRRIRRHFLHWRVVTDDMKHAYHARARSLLEQAAATPPASGREDAVTAPE